MAASTLVADNIPNPHAVTPRPRLGHENVAIRLPDGGELRPAAFSSRISLAGQWKFKGLDRQSEPFGPIADADLALLSPETDDTGWDSIAVPLNWWADSRFAYGKVFDKDEIYFRGYYRRTINVPDPADGKRRFLRFEEIGAEADIFVNGSFAGHHLGDFIPCEVEITRHLKQGDNLIALRILADLGPGCKDGVERYTRPYGARWDHTCIKGGIWHEAFLLEEPQVRIAEALIDPTDDFASVRIRGIIDNAGPAGDFSIVAALVEDTPATNYVAPCSTFHSSFVIRHSSFNFDITIPAPPSAKPWFPDDPNLYWAALAIADAATGRPVSAHLERFGFRTMRIEGNHFVLNGKPIYPVGDSLHSLHYGGNGTDVAIERLTRHLLTHKANGANMVRTAHMPAIPEVYDFADEIGMMIYDEWANCFCNNIDEEAFERSNLPALEKWLRRDYNHPSVTLWSLGNEVKHQAPEVARQLDKQYDLAKALDGQRRPVCAFSGVADTWNYGDDRVKTDFLDTHDYLGIDGDCWPTWFRSMNRHHADMAKTFGEDGELKMPLIMWECVGAGWDIRHDDEMKPGDRARYLEWMRKWSHWGAPPGIPFSASCGLLPILDSSRGRHYAQSYLATRLCELFRQDRRLAGFAPWFADATVPGATRWMQQVYPLLRNNATDDGRLMFLQLLSPGAKDVECVVVNDAGDDLDGAKMTVSLWTETGGEVALGKCDFGRIGVFEEGVKQFRLVIPDSLSGDGEVRLHLTWNGGEALNGYAVRLHPVEEAMAPISHARPVALAAPDARVEAILTRLGIPHTVGPAWPESGAVVVPPGAAYDGDAARAFVDGGGTLLLLEPEGSLLPGFPPLYVAPGTNHLAEIVVQSHPAFNGLAQADFDTWAENPCGIPVPRMACTLDEGVLLCRPRYIKGQNQHGMALCEYKVGEGRLLVSTLDATRLWGENGAATRYLRNLLAYVAGGAVEGAPPLRDCKATTERQADNGIAIVSPSAPLSLSFSASTEDATDPPAKILHFTDSLPKLATGNYHHLIVTFCSDTPDGLIDVTIPKSDHSSRLTYTIHTSLSHGEPVTLRLDLDRDFRLVTRRGFPLLEARGEIVLRNGFEKEWTPPFPRPPVEAEILEMRFE